MASCDDLCKKAMLFTVYRDPNTGQDWVHQEDDENEQHTHSPIAVELARLVKRLVQQIDAQRGYVLPSPAPSTQLRCPGQHSRFDPYGYPWHVYHDFAGVIHCNNRISVEDPFGSSVTSICQRLYYSWNSELPRGFQNALSSSQRLHNCTWFTMKAHKSKRHGLLSHCTCCKPASVLNIAWSPYCTKDMIEHCQQKLQAWIGLEFKRLPHDQLSTATLPSV